MGTPLKVAGSFFIAAGLIAITTLGMSSTSYAMEDPSANVQTTNTKQPRVEPQCSDKTTMTSRWYINNPNSAPVTIHWNNFENGLSGDYEALTGESTLYTGYNPADGNNTTRFSYPGTNLVDTTTNAQVSACQTETQPTQPVDPTPVECVDGKIQQNLSVTWVEEAGYVGVLVQTANGKPLCEDVTLTFTSYIMPANYDGHGFYGNPTATPQDWDRSVTLTLEKGTDGASIFGLKLPDSCNNVQVDLYYGDIIETVGPEGHSTRNIDSKVYLSTGACNPGHGAGPIEETPATPVTPVVPGRGAGAGTMAPAAANPVATEPLPAMLPETGGVNTNLSLLYAMLLGFVTYAALYIALPRRNEN